MLIGGQNPQLLDLSNTIRRTMVNWLKIPTPDGALLCNGYSKSIPYFTEKHNLRLCAQGHCPYLLQSGSGAGQNARNRCTRGLEPYFEELAAAIPQGASVIPSVVIAIQRKYDTYPPDL